MCSRSYFNGSAVNVMTVAENSFRPSTFNVLAGKENQVNPAIANLLALVDKDDLKTLYTQLAYSPGDTPETTWITRNSYGTDAVKAVNWVTRQFEATQASTTQFPFNAQMCNNVIAEFPGAVNPSQIVVFGAHLDCRNTQSNNGTSRAPGADDNGTGSAIAILFARLIQRQRADLGPFQKTLRIMTFCGEEQGLVGSRAIARQYKAENVNVVGMFNADMVGYRRNITGTQTPGPITLAFMNSAVNPDLTASCKAIVAQYLATGDGSNPPTYIGDTSGCCSDQQAFNEQGYPSLGVFETNTSSVVYPDYHRDTDTPDKVSDVQVAQFAKAIYSCTLTAVM